MATTAETTEFRPETCADCGWRRDREWRVRTAHKGPMPPGWRVEGRGQWRRIAARTRFTTLCGCDT